MVSLNQYFCMLTPTRPDMHGNITPAEAAVFGAHCDYLRGKFLTQEVLQAGTSFEKGQDGFAIVILSAGSKDAAVELMQADPAVAGGLLHARVTEYDVFLDRGAP